METGRRCFRPKISPCLDAQVRKQNVHGEHQGQIIRDEEQRRKPVLYKPYLACAYILIGLPNLKIATMRGKSRSNDKFDFLELERHCRHDCSYEIKRHLFLGRKAMTNLDSALRSRDITLSVKVCIVKAIVFPVVIYKCES